MDGFGSLPIFSLSSAHDFSTFENQDGSPKQKKILLLGTADPCHIIKTIAKLQLKRQSTNISSQATVLARTMLLLSIFLEPLENTSLRDRASLFLEIYGNTLISESTWKVVRDRVPKLIRSITDKEGLLGKLIDISNLKFRERDDIEAVFKFWINHSKSFDITKLWNYRIIKHIKQRYEYRENIFDWDYHSSIAEYAPVINKKNYLYWRETGIAFDLIESARTQPNRTLATADGIKEDGITVTKWGYFSDTTCSPYFAYGIETDNKDLLKKGQFEYLHTAVEISQFNVCAYMYEFHTGRPYTPEMHSKSDQLCEIYDWSTISENQSRESMRLVFLPCDPKVTFSTRRSRFLNQFDMVFVAVSMAHRLPDCCDLLKDKYESIIFIESPRHLVELKKENLLEYGAKILESVQQTKFRFFNDCNSKPPWVLENECLALQHVKK